MSEAAMGEGTCAVRTGLSEPVKNEPTLPGPVFSAHFHLPGEVSGPYAYGRDENPTWTHPETPTRRRLPGSGCGRPARRTGTSPSPRAPAPA